jgi:hypothetical protein
LTNKEMMRLASARSIVPEISEAVDAAIMVALNPDPNARPADCLEFFKLLTARDSNGGPPAPAPLDAGAERRSSTRYLLRVGCCAVIDPSIHGGDEEKWPLVVRDVSSSGIGILLARRFEPGTELAVEGIGGPFERISARVVRVEPERAGHWIHGCAFAQPLAEDQLQSLLEMA